MNKGHLIQAEQGKVCVIDKYGRILIMPKVEVDTLYYPSFTYCLVKKDGMYGYIDDAGELIIPFKYKDAYPFSENGLAFVVNEKGLGGYINASDQFVIPPKYLSGSHFKFGFAAVKKQSGNYEYIYSNGTKAIDHTFKYASGFSDCGLAVVQDMDEEYVLIDVTSRLIVGFEKGCVVEDYKENSRLTKFRKNGREALVNAAGDVITGFYDQVIISPYSHLNPFFRDGLWGFVDMAGKEAIPNIYLEVSEFNEDKLALVKAFDPLAPNQINEFYINHDDEIIDPKSMQASREQYYKSYSKVNKLIKGMALAEMKNMDEPASYLNE